MKNRFLLTAFFSLFAGLSSVFAQSGQFESGKLISDYQGTSLNGIYLGVLGLLAILIVLWRVYNSYQRYRETTDRYEKASGIAQATWFDVFGSGKKLTEEHEVDGIHEQDNNPPSWFNWLFYGSVVFAIFYVSYYYVFRVGKLPDREYADQVKKAEILISAAQEKALEFAGLPPYKDKDHLDEGKGVFLKNCMACHGPDGQGNIGPNLTDDYWLHGGQYKQVFTTIFNGVPEKGMLSWKKSLKPEEIRLVASYVKSLRGTNPSNPKAPQGEKVVTD